MAKWRLPEFLNSRTSPDQASEELATDGAEKVEYDGDPKLADRPLDRSILWLPGGWGEFQRGPPRKHELFVEQEVLRRVDSHANERIEGAYGLLIAYAARRAFRSSTLKGFTARTGRFPSTTI